MTTHVARRTKSLAVLGSLASLLLGAPALADEWPKVSGSLGIVVPFATFAINADDTFIGSDFLQLGVSPDLNLQLDERWTVSFEFIAFSRWEYHGPGHLDDVSTSLVVVDPGVLYDLKVATVGLRSAVSIGEHVPFNFALVPLVNKAFPISAKLKYYVELDLPLGYSNTPFANAVYSLTGQLRTGVSF
jgi:hypothetical protein